MIWSVLHLQPVGASGLHTVPQRDTNSDRQKRGHAKIADAHKSHITRGVRGGLLGLSRPLLVSTGLNVPSENSQIALLRNYTWPQVIKSDIIMLCIALGGSISCKMHLQHITVI